MPVANFSFASTNGGCTPDSVLFTNSSTGANFYIWDFGDFSSADSSVNPSHNYLWQGVFIITLTAYDTLTGDSDVVTDIIVIQYKPDPFWAWFYYTPFSPVCFGASIDFSTFLFPTPDYYTWDFGDGDSASSANPSHTYSSPGTYVVTMIAGNSCGTDSYSDTIVISTTAPPPFPSYSAFPNPVCPGTPVDFYDWSWPIPTSWAWSFGDGDSAFTQNASHTYPIPGTYLISSTVSNGCNDTTLFDSIVVDNSIIPLISAWSYPDTVCPGDSTYFTTFGSDLTSYSWDFGDTNFSLQQNPNHVYANTGIFDAVVTGTNGCGNSNTDTVEVVVTNSAAPNSWFNASPSSFCPSFSNICVGMTVTFTNWSYKDVSSLWDFGDGNTSMSTNPTHIYADTGNYIVKLVSTSSCGGQDSIWQCIRVEDDVVPSPFFCTNPSCFPTYTICVGGNVQFNNWSSDTLNCFWDFGDGDTSNLVNPSHVYADTGLYIVTLSVTNTCGNTGTFADAINVTLNGPGPGNSGFGTSPFSPCPGEPTWFWPFGFTGSAWFWDFGDGNTSTLQNPTNYYAAKGTYTVTYIVYNSCSSDTSTMNITVKDGAIADFSYASICLGDSVDFLDASSPTPTSWAWDFGDGDTSTTQNPTHGFDSAGVSYNVSLTVVYNSCVTSVTKTIVVGEILLSSSQVDASCGLANGIATVVPLGGTLPYTYQWDDFGTQTTASATGLGAGVYNVTVTDASACNNTYSVTLTNTAVPTVSISSNADVSCKAFCDGFAVAIASSGTPLYTYLWDDPGTQNTASATGLCEGTFKILVTDANGCMDSANVTISEPTLLSSSIIDSTMANCGGVCDGLAEVAGSGGTTPYFYAWNNPSAQTTSAATGLCAGVSNVTVTDGNGCTTISSVSITEPPLLTASFTDTTHLMCASICIGNATVAGAGGNPPYTYLWDDPMLQTNAMATGLCAGTFNPSVTDADGCTSTNSIAINAPAALLLTTSNTDAACGMSDGTATVVVTGGTGSYTYLWDDPGTQTTAAAVGLGAGVYTVLITDGNGCTDSSSVPVNNAGAPTVTISASTNVSCNGANDGQATVTATGGTAPLTYLWNDPGAQTSTTATGLGGGTYSATVTDANGCIASDIVVITEPTAINISYLVDSATFGVDDGAINASVSGGLSPYTYSWSSAQTTQDLDSIFAGTYTLSVTDSNGCVVSAAIVVGEYTSIMQQNFTEDKIALYPNPVSETLTISLELIAYSNAEIAIYNLLGERLTHDILLGVQSTEYSQDISDFTNGVYLIEFRLNNSDNSVTNQRVIRKKITVVR